jgi:hypothetical protein
MEVRADKTSSSFVCDARYIVWYIKGTDLSVSREKLGEPCDEHWDRPLRCITEHIV